MRNSLSFPSSILFKKEMKEENLFPYIFPICSILQKRKIEEKEGEKKNAIISFLFSFLSSFLKWRKKKRARVFTPALSFQRSSSISSFSAISFEK
jgi:hypothetical protein